MSVSRSIFTIFCIIWCKTNACKTCEFSNVQLHLFISNLAPACQIQLSVISLESHNLQESKVPLALIKLKVPKKYLINGNISGIFGFPPRPTNRSICAINLHYFKEEAFNLVSNPTDPVSLYFYSVYVSNCVFKRQLYNYGIQPRPSYFAYNIWLTNDVRL